MKTINSGLERQMTRRDRCHWIGVRALKLNAAEKADAWELLSQKLADELSMRDMPKFNDLLIAVRVATIRAKQRNRARVRL